MEHKDQNRQDDMAGGTAGESLVRLPFFHGADPAIMARAAPLARWISVEANRLVVDFGDDDNDVFLVVNGALRVLIRTPLGQEMILCDVGPGDVFGEVAAIDGTDRSASVVALRETRLCRLPAAAFLDIALHAPEVGTRLLRTLTMRLRREDERLFELTALPVRERLAAELLRLSRPRSDGSRVISPPPPQHVIAARIGARRETVSLSLRSLSERNLVEVSARAIGLPRPDDLRAWIDARLNATQGERSGALVRE
jgi:CRP/FNR family cyclic AMP-dependent transcriptional regulator